MNKIYYVFISIIFVSSVFAQEKIKEKNDTNGKTEYSKEKAKQVNAVNKEMDNKENKIFGSAKSSGAEVKLNKVNHQNTITNEELVRQLNNPQKMKK